MSEFGLTAKSVSEILKEVKHLLEINMRQILVEGEVTNISYSSSGHWYFNISDPDSSLSCALFKMDALRNPMIKKIKNGDKIQLFGDINVYSKRGTFQLIVKKLIQSGTGNLKVQFEILKKKLAEEGLFDIERKKKIPRFPNRIALITSPHGAAVYDFLNVLKRRSHFLDVLIVPALMQGQDAPKSIIAALDRIYQLDEIDLVVITRGGGSEEDLWAFNDELLTRTISESSVPIISAIGHEIDYTLCDYVSDLRAETPTAAAEIISEPQVTYKEKFTHLGKHLRQLLLNHEKRILIIKNNINPLNMFSLLQKRIYKSRERLFNINVFNKPYEVLNIYAREQFLDELKNNLHNYVQRNYVRFDNKLKNINSKITALNPQNVLKRGFSFISSQSHIVVSSTSIFDNLKQNEELKIHFNDGTRSVKK